MLSQVSKSLAVVKLFIKRQLSLQPRHHGNGESIYIVALTHEYNGHVIISVVTPQGYMPESISAIFMVTRNAKDFMWRKNRIVLAKIKMKFTSRCVKLMQFILMVVRNWRYEFIEWPIKFDFALPELCRCTGNIP